MWQDAERLGEGGIWMQRSEITGGFVDAAIPFAKSVIAAGKPFYINLWPDDVHGPFWPPVDKWADGKRGLYLSVLQEMDRQLGKLFAFIRDDPKLRGNTLVLICSDNGPEKGAGTAGPFRGYKTHLYEGGIRSSLVAWGPGLVSKQGHIDRESVFSAIDLVPSLLDLAKVAHPEGVKFDGESVSNILLGKGGSRQAPIFYRRPPDRNAYYGDDDLPDLAVRKGKWKLLCEFDGSIPELYDLSSDPGESTNIAAKQPAVVAVLSKTLLNWHASMPADNGAALAKVKKKKKK
ncbi:MAG: arylsulfatase A-like enzyme [Rhodothermales bacterium]